MNDLLEMARELVETASREAEKAAETHVKYPPVTEELKDKISSAVASALSTMIPDPEVTNVTQSEEDPNTMLVEVRIPITLVALQEHALQEHVDRLAANKFLEEGDILDQDYLKNLVDIGAFEVETDKLIISDPCYDVGTWCMGSLSPVKPGRWHASVERGDYVGWGERICKLVAVHKHHTVGDLEFRMTPIDVGVDSGQAGIFDERYFRDDYDISEEDFGSEPWDCDGPFYSACGSHTLSKKGAGCLKHGTVASSGVGDGSYNCYAAEKEGLIVGVALDFLVGPEHKGEWEDEDDVE